MTNQLCRTATRGEDGRLRDCGQPATDALLVGAVLYHYCSEHAGAARRFVERMGDEEIAAIQQQTLRLEAPPTLDSEVLNAACWAFVTAMPCALPAPIFSALKPAVTAAIDKYLALSQNAAMK